MYIWKVTVNGDFQTAMCVAAKTREEAISKAKAQIDLNFNCATIEEDY